MARMPSMRFNRTATGYVAGGGVEYRGHSCWLGSSNIGAGTWAKDGNTVNDDAFHTVRVGLNYHLQPNYEPLK